MKGNVRPSIQEKIQYFPMKLKLDFYITLNKYPKNINNFKLIRDFSEISKILDIGQEEIIKFLYFNKNNIHEVLYKDDILINVVFNDDKNNFTCYFYLDLLIQDEENLINYVYKIDFIDNINSYQNSIDTSLKFKKLLVSKIILDLIKNYKETDNYDSFKDDEKLNYFEKVNIDIIKKNINYFQNYIKIYELNILNEKIEIIYVYIIIAFLKYKRYNNIQEIDYIIKELDLETIDLTEKMIDEISKIFIKNKELINENKIINIHDLFKNINFYHLIFKYLIKNQIFIYNCPFLLKTRRTLLKLNFNERLHNLSFDISKDKLEKINFILEKIIDSKFYYNKDNNLINNNNSTNSNNTNNNSTNSNNISNSNNNSTNSNNNSANNNNNSSNNSSNSNNNNQSSSYSDNNYKTKDPEIDDDDSNGSLEQDIQTNGNYQIITFDKILNIKYEYSAEFVKEIDNNNVLVVGDKKINILDSRNNYESKIEKKSPDWINKIIYEKEEQKEKIKVESGNELYDLSEKNEMKKLPLKFDENIKINFIININKTKYIIYDSYMKSVILVKELFNPIMFQDLIELEKGFYKEGIKINDKIICLTSNKVMSGGEDKIIFCSANSPKIYRKIKNYSFKLSYTGLCLISLKDKRKLYNFLLCACKKYVKGQKNGILLINNLDLIDNKIYDEKNNVRFYETDNFEVHCFCHLFKNTNSNIFNEPNINDNFFLVGGFDTLRKRGSIKLFKMILIQNQYFEIEEVEEIKIWKHGGLQKFTGPISCITQMSNDGKILATSWDGKIYSFDIPDFEFLLSFEQENFFHKFNH